jgi:thymidylate synthase (FAD)
VCLVDVMPRLVERGGLGPEAAIVQAARISYGAGTKTVRTDEGLLRYLFRNAHMTPFEMVVLKWRVRAPLFTARQWMRHRAGSYNEVSARYSVIGSDYYIPEPDDVCGQSAANRQGSGEPLNPGIAKMFHNDAADLYWRGDNTYRTYIEAGVAREMARIVLPEGRYTSFYWTVNLRNLFGFLELRMDSHAQDNIRGYARAIYDILRDYCPLAVRAFDDYVLDAVKLSALEVKALRGGEAPPEMSARERDEWQKKREKLGL